MKPTKKTAQFAGILFLIQLIPYYIGHDSILGSILYAPNYLAEIYASKDQVNIAVLLELTSAFAFVGFSIILYQILKKYNQNIALAYIGLRFVEFGIIILSEIKLMVLAAIGKQFIEAETGDSFFIQVVGDSLLAEWEWTALLYMIVFCVNALLFYYLLWNSKLVPQFISIWGFVGALIAILAPILIMFEQNTGGMIIYAPIGLNELFLAIWLIVKGFNSTAIETKPEKANINI